MGRFWKCFSLLLLPFLLTGCKKATHTPPSLVTQVTVTGIIQDSPVQADYSDPQKMEVILFYLRGLESLGRPDRDPERILGDHVRITVTLSDGSCHIYHQRANRFLSRDSQPWQRIDPQKAHLLAPLLKSLG